MRILKLLSLFTLVLAFSLGTGKALAQSPSGLTLGTNLVDVSQVAGNETDPSIVISPLNASNMFVTAALDGVQPGLFVAWTTNMGVTWNTNIIATNGDANGLAAAYGEPSAAWDTFGNIFVAYLPADFEGVTVISSTNGGRSFDTFTNIAPLDATDQPRLTTPPAGAGAGSVWLVYKDYTLANSPLVVQGELSAGLGTNGQFTPEVLVPNSANGGFPDIGVGPAGQVMVVYQDSLNSPNPASIYASIDTNAIGTNGFGTNFNLPVTIATDAIGGATNPPVEPSGVGLNASPGVAFDCDNLSPYYGRAYVVFTAAGPNGNMVINTAYSTNNGAAWSPEIQVNDDTTSNDHFFPRVAVDPATGIVGYVWMDCRNDQGVGVGEETKTSTLNLLANVIVTNVTFSGPITNNSSILTSWMDLSGGGGTNILITISGNVINGIKLTSNSPTTIYMSSATATNTTITLQGMPTNAMTKVQVLVTSTYPNTFSLGPSPNESAMPYTTLSTNGAGSFYPNQPVVDTNLLTAPAVSVASYVSGSGSLTGWGYYIGLAAAGANFVSVWPDNTDMTGNNPDGAASHFDLYSLGGSNAITVPTADISVFVTNSPNPVVSAGVLVYTMVVSNNGPKPSGPIVVTDVLPTNVTLVTVVPGLNVNYTNFVTNLVFAIANLNPRTSLTNTIRVEATTSAWATNLAVAEGQLIDLKPTNNTDQSIILIAGEDLALGMTTTETNALIGDFVTNAITVTNFGPSTNGPVIITNYLSPNWGNISVQTPGAYFFTNEVVAGTNGYATNPIVVINLGLLQTNTPISSLVIAQVLSYSPYASNYVEVSSLDVDTNESNNSAAISTFVNGEDLGIGLSSVSNVNLADALVYTLSVTNFGPSYTGLVTVTDILSSDLSQILASQSQGTNSISGGETNPTVIFSLGPIGAGQVATMTITAAATGGLASVTNRVSVESTDFDTNAANNTASNVVTINGEDLGAGISASRTSVQVGQDVVLTTLVTNFGPASNAVVFVTNTLSSRLGQITVLPSNYSYTNTGNQYVFDIGPLGVGQSTSVAVDAIALSTGSASDTATVGSGGLDTNTLNNSAKVNLTIIPALPMISNLVVTPLASSAFISFKTGAAATAQVQYGLTSSYGRSSSTQMTASSNHVFLLSGLTRDTNYYFKVVAWVNGNVYTTNGSFATIDTLILPTSAASYSGKWTVATSANGFYGSYYQTAQTTNVYPTATATYIPQIPATGLYNVSMWYPQSANFTSNAPLSLSGATNQVSITLNQTTNGGGWLPLANDFYFAAGQGGNAVIYNDTGATNQVVVANAMRWVYDPAQDYLTNGSLPAWWATYFFGTNVSGTADLNGSGYSTYDDYVLGLNPTNANDAVNFTVTQATGVVSVNFSPWQGGRDYILLSASDLSAPVWTPLTNSASVNTNGDGVFTLTQPGAASQFYRLSASLVPQ